jgi:hypothetical protein
MRPPPLKRVQKVAGWPKKNYKHVATAQAATAFATRKEEQASRAERLGERRSGRVGTATWV